MKQFDTTKLFVLTAAIVGLVGSTQSHAKPKAKAPKPSSFDEAYDFLKIKAGYSHWNADGSVTLVNPKILFKASTGGQQLSSDGGQVSVQKQSKSDSREIEIPTEIESNAICQMMGYPDAKLEGEDDQGSRALPLNIESSQDKKSIVLSALEEGATTTSVKTWGWIICNSKSSKPYYPGKILIKKQLEAKNPSTSTAAQAPQTSGVAGDPNYSSVKVNGKDVLYRTILVNTGYSSYQKLEINESGIQRLYALTESDPAYNKATLLAVHNRTGIEIPGHSFPEVNAAALTSSNGKPLSLPSDPNALSNEVDVRISVRGMEIHPRQPNRVRVMSPSYNHLLNNSELAGKTEISADAYLYLDGSNAADAVCKYLFGPTAKVWSTANGEVPTKTGTRALIAAPADGTGEIKFVPDAVDQPSVKRVVLDADGKIDSFAESNTIITQVDCNVARYK